MTKRASEAELGKALRDMDLEPYVYRIPDPKAATGVSNWKPCDFLVWWTAAVDHSPDGFLVVHTEVRSAWVEAKDTDAVTRFAYADLRPSQISGIREAKRLGIPYILAVYWRRARRWTISDATAVLGWFDDPQVRPEHVQHAVDYLTAHPGERLPAEMVDPQTSIPRELLMSRFGVDAAPRDLGQTIKVILEDGW